MSLKCANPQEVWINPIDAQPRNIKNGDMIRILMIAVKYVFMPKSDTANYPGVVALGEGAWHQADMFGNKVDHSGCVNVLTTQRPSPLAKESATFQLN